MNKPFIKAKDAERKAVRAHFKLAKGKVKGRKKMSLREHNGEKFARQQLITLPAWKNEPLSTGRRGRKTNIPNDHWLQLILDWFIEGYDCEAILDRTKEIPMERAPELYTEDGKHVLNVRIIRDYIRSQKEWAVTTPAGAMARAQELALLDPDAMLLSIKGITYRHLMSADANGDSDLVAKLVPQMLAITKQEKSAKQSGEAQTAEEPTRNYTNTFNTMITAQTKPETDNEPNLLPEPIQTASDFIASLASKVTNEE